VSTLTAMRIALAIDRERLKLERLQAEADAAGREDLALEARRERLMARAFKHADEIMRQEGMR
jgi:hypothetical protein